MTLNFDLICFSVDISENNQTDKAQYFFINLLQNFSKNDKIIWVMYERF